MSVPPSDSVQSAATWMDRLSDRFGALVPGADRLPPRHPLKVSLVMGIAGGVAGWLTAGIVIALETWIPVRTVHIGFVVPGTLLGGLVFLPLLLWKGSSAIRCGFALILSLAATWFHLLLIRTLGDGGASVIGFTAAGLLGGLGYALAGEMLFRLRSGWGILTMMLVTAGVQWVIAALAILLTGYSQLINMALATMLTANWLAPIFACLGIVFGRAVWDTTPRPKFEPSEAT